MIVCTWPAPARAYQWWISEFWSSETFMQGNADTHTIVLLDLQSFKRLRSWELPHSPVTSKSKSYIRNTDSTMKIWFLTLLCRFLRMYQLAHDSNWLYHFLEPHTIVLIVNRSRRANWTLSASPWLIADLIWASRPPSSSLQAYTMKSAYVHPELYHDLVLRVLSNHHGVNHR